MTHSKVKEKFLIEYDKANVTSSYPSLTSYEIETILDKAYLALIAQKVTGNNPRSSAFEADVKSISDIQPLISTANLTINSASYIDNSVTYLLPKHPNDEFLYFVSATVTINEQNAIVNLISHDAATKFKQTISNRPWIKNSVCYIEGDKLVLLYDNYSTPTDDNDLDEINLKRVGSVKLTYIKKPAAFAGDSSDDDFELNDSMAEELVSLAVLFALENVESQRTQSKAQMRGLEA